MASGGCLEDERQEELRPDDTYQLTDRDSALVASCKLMRSYMYMFVRMSSAQDQSSSKVEHHADMCILLDQ